MIATKWLTAALLIALISNKSQVSLKNNKKTDDNDRSGTVGVDDINKIDDKKTKILDIDFNGLSGFDIQDITELFNRMDKLKSAPFFIKSIQNDMITISGDRKEIKNKKINYKKDDMSDDKSDENNHVNRENNNLKLNRKQEIDEKVKLITLDKEVKKNDEIITKIKKVISKENENKMNQRADQSVNDTYRMMTDDTNKDALETELNNVLTGNYYNSKQEFNVFLDKEMKINFTKTLNDIDMLKKIPGYKNSKASVKLIDDLYNFDNDRKGSKDNKDMKTIKDFNEKLDIRLINDVNEKIDSKLVNDFNKKVDAHLINEFNDKLVIKDRTVRHNDRRKKDDSDSY